MDAEVPARHPRPVAPVTVWSVAPRAAPRRPVHHRGRGDAAGRSRKAARYRSDAERQFRADAGAISRGARHDAATGAKAETEAGLSPPQTRLSKAFSSESLPRTRCAWRV